MLKGKTVAVGTTAVDLLAGIDADRPLELLIRHETLSIDVYLGDSSVTTSNGFKLDANDTSALRIHLHGDSLYAIANNTGNLYILVIGDK